MISRYTGKTFETNSYGKLEVLEDSGGGAVLVRFLDTGYTRTARLGDVKRGKVKDLMRKNLHGIACLGSNIEKFSKEDRHKGYHIYRWMLERCYVESCGSYSRYGGRGVTVCEDWLRFDNFLTWFLLNYREGFHLEKDILSPKGYPMYSPSTCCFVPREINGFFSSTNTLRGEFPLGVYKDEKSGKFVAIMRNGGKERVRLGTHETPDAAFSAYKEAKEKRCKSLAEKYRGVIDENVYLKLMKWECDPFPL